MEELLRELIRKELKNAGFWRSIPATVTAVDGDLLTVELADDSVEVSGIPNKTGETVSVSNQVYVVKLNNQNNMVALIKK